MHLPPKRVSFLIGFILCAGLARADVAQPIANPGFEANATSWVAAQSDKDASLSTVVAEAAHTGKLGLRVNQSEGGPGSWFQSSKAPLVEGKAYRLQFWARTLKTSGVGVWVQFYDADGKEVKAPAPLAVQVPQDSPEWTLVSLNVNAPAGATQFTLAVHCYSKRATQADFDDFALVDVTADKK